VSERIRSNPVNANGKSRSRESEEFSQIEKICEERLSECFQMLIEPRLQSIASQTTEAIRDARSSIIAELRHSGQFTFLSNSEASSIHTRNSLPSVAEDSTSMNVQSTITVSPVATQMAVQTNNIVSTSTCLDDPPPPDPSMLAPTLEQARSNTIQPCYTVVDSGYHSSESVVGHDESNVPTNQTAETSITNADSTNILEMDDELFQTCFDFTFQ
jgi:hypothetical protein